MNLRSLANNACSLVNPNVPAILKKSTGYTIGSDRRQIPSYVEYDIFAQLQEMGSDDLKQLDGLNIQGDLKTVYITGDLSAVVRPDSYGGDVIVIAGKDWLITKVLENWPDWSKAIICYQGVS
jgi:hypothetical protein